MFKDINEQKDPIPLLRENEEQLKTIANLLPMVVWITDKSGSFTYLNASWEKLCGKTTSQGYGRLWMDLIHPEDQTKAASEWERFLAEKKPNAIWFRYLNARGAYVPIKLSGNPWFNVQGHLHGYIGTLEDMSNEEYLRFTPGQRTSESTTDLLQKNEELRRSEELYHRMVDEVEDYAIIRMSREGLIENWNKGAEKIKGYTAQEIIGNSFKVFYSREDQERGLPDMLIEKALHEGKAGHEGWRVRKNGTVFWGSIVITALHDEHGQVIGFTKVTRDLTERKAAEDSLKATAAALQEKNQELERINQELGSFAYISSHDLQEPLRKIQTFSNRILEVDEANLSDKSKDYFNRIQASAQRMRSLIDDLLTYSRTTAADMEFVPTDLGALFREVQLDMQDLMDEKKAVVTMMPLPQLKIIRFQFRQLAQNILANALKFSRPGVDLRITINADIVGGAQANSPLANAKKEYHHISIADNGIGFDTKHSARIFEIFQRLHSRKEYEGTGVGLAICKKIVENHSGFMTAEGVVNEGAVFHIYLPV